MNHELVRYHDDKLCYVCILCMYCVYNKVQYTRQGVTRQAALLPSWCSCGRWWQQRRAGQGGMAYGPML